MTQTTRENKPLFPAISRPKIEDVPEETGDSAAHYVPSSRARQSHSHRKRQSERSQRLLLDQLDPEQRFERGQPRRPSAKQQRQPARQDRRRRERLAEKHDRPHERQQREAGHFERDVFLEQHRLHLDGPLVFALLPSGGRRREQDVRQQTPLLDQLQQRGVALQRQLVDGPGQEDRSKLRGLAFIS